MKELICKLLSFKEKSLNQSNINQLSICLFLQVERIILSKQNVAKQQIQYFHPLASKVRMEKPKIEPTKAKKQKIGKKQQLADKKQKKIKEQSEIFNQRKKKQQNPTQPPQNTTKPDQKEYTLDNIDVSSSQLQVASKKLMKKAATNGKSKAPKPPAKIKVKNKFFADLNIEINEQVVEEKKQDKNLIEQELSNSNSRKMSITNSSSSMNLDKTKDLSRSSNQSRFQSFVKRTDFIRARHDFKKPEEDPKYKSSVKKMLAEVQEAEEVVISDLSVPQIHRNKLISSSIYINHERFKKPQNKKIQIETSKKLTAEEIIMDRKMLKNRDYFYKKLTQRIKEERAIKIHEVQAQNTTNELKNTGFTQNSQKTIVKDSEKQVTAGKSAEKEKTNDETSYKVLTENSSPKH